MDKKITNRGAEHVDAFRWTILRGYVFQLTAEDETAWDCSVETELEDGYVHTEEGRFGYHGADVPPCGADYLYCSPDGREFLVISCESDPADIDVVDGFTLAPVSLAEGDSRDDGQWRFVVLEVDPHDLETTLAGKC
jgi:hypothetical protein